MRKLKYEIPPELTATRLYLMEQAAAVAQVGRTRIYQDAAAGRLKTVKIGRCRRVRAADLHEYLASLTGGDAA